MPTAYLEDVKEAILAANKKFEAKTTGEIQQHFEVATVTVMFQQIDDRWDYGHPAMYEMDQGHIGELETWWKEIHPTGTVLPRVWKPALNHYEVNVQWATDSGRLFNYHVSVT